VDCAATPDCIVFPMLCLTHMIVMHSLKHMVLIRGCKASEKIKAARCPSELALTFKIPSFLA